MLKRLALGLAVTLMAVSCKKTQIEYPAAPSDGTVYEVFGMTVNDTYRPLENDTSAETSRWVDAENAVTRAYLDSKPRRAAIESRLAELFNYSRVGAPWRGNDGKYYRSVSEAGKNQPLIFRSDNPAETGSLFLDPNALSDDGTVALAGLDQSRDGRYTAYSIHRNGSDWVEFYVMDTETGQLLDDHIEWAKFSGAEWDADGFYYSAYDRPAAGSEFSGANTFHKVYYHKLGTQQSEDELIYVDNEHPLHFHQADLVGDGRYLAISASGQGHGNSVVLKDLQNPHGGWKVAEPGQDSEITFLDAPDGKLVVFTNADAPRGRVAVIDPAAPARANWRTLIAEDPEGGVLVSAQYVGKDKMIAVFDRDASHHAYIYDKDGNRLSEITLPTYGNVAFNSDTKSNDVFYSFSSFTFPWAAYSLNIDNGESTLLNATEIEGLNPEDYITEQVFYTSEDGTRVPMFIVRRTDVEPNGHNPVYLYGYGGFNIGLNPNFAAQRLYWLENGGIYAQTNLRGGSEYGESWHQAGTKMNKLNVFNDFIAAANYMIDQNWTDKDHIVIEGGSNGGLLVGAVTNMRPDLFSVAIPRVGVMDMMRYHLFTIGWNWAHDYGTADDSEEMARYLLDYSPIHNISNDGTPYPAILVTTADHDDRVVPAHSFKYAATLQASDTGKKPKLIRIDSNAGHGGGKPLSKVKDEYADIYTFIEENIGKQQSDY